MSHFGNVKRKKQSSNPIASNCLLNEMKQENCPRALKERKNMNAFEILLENYWIIKSADRDLYYRVKDSAEEYETFLRDKVGYRLIVNPNLIKLEKTPGKPEPWMGIQGFDQPLDYAFLCFALAFLEDKSQGEQFILSEITDYIQSAWRYEPAIDWTVYNNTSRR